MNKIKNQIYDGIIIIGNGFDLNLGLNTSYSSFIKSSHFIRLVKLKDNLAIYLNNINNLNNWIDIEKELKNYANNKNVNKNDFHQQFKNLSQALTKYLGELNFENLKEDSQGYKLIKQISSEKHTTLLIDFNYTSTISNIFKKLEFEYDTEDSNIDHIKIHGSIENNNIIFGVEDNANIPEKDIFLKKSVNKNFNPIDFSSAISNCKHLILFGYSLGETDYMYFKDYFKSSVINSNRYQKQHILIYHYGEQSYYDIFAQIDKLTNKNIMKFKQLNSVKPIDTN